MFTNLFVAIEAYRLGYTNIRQEKNVIAGLKDRFHVYFKIPSYVDILKLLLLLLFIAGIQICIRDIMIVIGVLLIAIILAAKLT